VAWSSCEKDPSPFIDDSDLLIGYWDNPVGMDTLVRYERAAGLKENAYSLGFKAGHAYVERKSDGFCGTPPVTLKDYSGTWSRQDSMIDITVAYWGGISHYRLKIIVLDRNSLTVAQVNQQFEP
jgi:hypothetical protein